LSNPAVGRSYAGTRRHIGLNSSHIGAGEEDRASVPLHVQRSTAPITLPGLQRAHCGNLWDWSHSPCRTGAQSRRLDAQVTRSRLRNRRWCSRSRTANARSPTPRPSPGWRRRRASSGTSSRASSCTLIGAPGVPESTGGVVRTGPDLQTLPPATPPRHRLQKPSHRPSPSPAPGSTTVSWPTPTPH